MIKGWLNKSKTIFGGKKEEEAKDGSNNHNDFDSEEDHDIIEVGKNHRVAVSAMPSSLIITSNHGSGNGGGASAATGGSPPTHQPSIIDEKANKGFSSAKLLMDFAGSTLSAADTFIHGGSKKEGAE